MRHGHLNMELVGAPRRPVEPRPLLRVRVRVRVRVSAPRRPVAPRPLLRVLVGCGGPAWDGCRMGVGRVGPTTTP